MSEHAHDIVEDPNRKPRPTDHIGIDPELPTPDILLWKPSLFALFLSGVVAGALLGAANGALAHYILFELGSPWTACLWGIGLGMAGGIAVVLFRRIVWGPDIGVEVGTVLGLLYGIVPGATLWFQSIVVARVVIANWGFVGFVMASSMAGLLIGGLMDRLTEAIIARKKRRAASQSALPRK